ncbi:MAG TPA: hypothetical protein VFY09_00610 [Flavobacteriaceae bacterium]|nr:hypothetical protein [Flavobacteriaceae bacterium]HEX5742382.1 hypothetical protein [Flavobacteriaceae bacterium]
MKKIFTILVTILLLTNCQEEKTFDLKITDSLNGFLKDKSAGDKFLEIESFEIIKEYTVKERKEKVNENTLNAVRTMNETFPSPDILAQFEKEFEFLNKQTDETAIALYEVKFVVKKETLINEEIPTDYKAMILNDKDLSVIFMSIFKEVSHH